MKHAMLLLIVLAVMFPAHSFAAEAEPKPTQGEIQLAAKIARLKAEATADAALKEAQAAYVDALVEVVKTAIKEKAFGKAGEIVKLIEPLDAKRAKKLTAKIKEISERPIVGVWKATGKGITAGLACHAGGKLIARYKGNKNLCFNSSWERLPDGAFQLNLFRVRTWVVTVTGKTFTGEGVTGVLVRRYPKKKK